MGMPKGLAKATAYFNNLAAREDWRRLAAEVTAAGFADLVVAHQPPEGAGWRQIDRAISRLKAAVAARQRAGPA